MTQQSDVSVEALIRRFAVAFETADLSYGHGTDSPLDEAAWLVFAKLGLSHDDAESAYAGLVDSRDVVELEALARRRIDERVPLAYLINQAWFAGLEFFVDERVLVPRSPFAELIQDQFAPWVDMTSLKRIADLGTGSACIAIALAKAFPDAMIDAIDISAEALEVAAINVERHGVGDRLRLLQSDFFADLKDDYRYDLIVSNPPVIPGPGSACSHGNDSLELDEFHSRLLADASQQLSEGGCLQMLCECVEIAGEPWQERLQAWVQGTGCDTWMLHNPPVSPAVYASGRISELQGDMADDDRAYDDWLAYFDSRNVVAIHPGMVVLRKRRGDNWFHVQDMATNLAGDSGEAVQRGIVAHDFLSQTDDDALLDAKVSLSPHLVLDQEYSRTIDSWQLEMSVLNMSDGMPMEAEVDMPVMAFLNLLNGTRTVADCISEFAEAADSDESKIRNDYLPMVRLFMGRGFLVPPKVKNDK